MQRNRKYSFTVFLIKFACVQVKSNIYNQWRKRSFKELKKWITAPIRLSTINLLIITEPVSHSLPTQTIRPVITSQKFGRLAEATSIEGSKNEATLFKHFGQFDCIHVYLTSVDKCWLPHQCFKKSTVLDRKLL